MANRAIFSLLFQYLWRGLGVYTTDEFYTVMQLNWINTELIWTTDMLVLFTAEF